VIESGAGAYSKRVDKATTFDGCDEEGAIRGLRDESESVNVSGGELVDDEKDHCLPSRRTANVCVYLVSMGVSDRTWS
jgi:hypothetical protein